MKKFHIALGIVAALSVFAPQPVHAQVAYEDVVEKIHYTDPTSRGEAGNQRFEAVKEIGSQQPQLKVFMYGDLNGQFTKKFFQNTFNTLKNTYADKAVFVYKHYPFPGQEKSVRIGMIAECAAAQGQFWGNVEPIMEHLDNIEDLRYLRGIDQAQLRTCLADPYTRTIVVSSGEYAKYFGLNGNPILLIQNASKPEAYSIKVSGAQDISIFERAFLEAEQGDINKQEMDELKSQVSELRQDVEQNKQDLQQVHAEQSQFAQELEKMKEQLIAFFEQVKRFFTPKSV